MTMPRDGHDESPALAGLTDLYRTSVEIPTDGELDLGLDTVLCRVAAGKGRHRRALRRVLLGATVAACCIAALWSLRARRNSRPVPEPAALAYQIAGGSVVEGGYLREAGHDGIQLHFSEGSELALTSGTRGRLREVDGHGAHVAIERGTASFQIKPHAARRWLVDAGPFLVTVKGTVFTVAWDPLAEQFQLSLKRGRVVVSGPVSAGEISMRGGQRLVVNLARAETVITEETAAQASAGTGAAPSESVPSVEPQPVNESSRASHASRLPLAASDRRWSDELAQGHWDRILNDAKRLGVDATLAKASSDDLFALADAARYRRRPDLARAALLAERRRFPDSPRALDTLFLLGRVEELRQPGIGQAIGWYDAYLSAAPDGPLVGEALGRKMILTDKRDGATRARPIAEDYLRRFPKGSYAAVARELTFAH